MKKIILILFTFLLNVSTSYSQTTATNFTATDCNSNSHTLFAELDNGKIIVLVWIMPCAMCINDALGAYHAVQSFATSHPGKVLYYLIDDIGDANCSSLSTWATTNGIDVSKISIFSNAGNAIKENDYGGNGMPHVTIIGGSNHKIYANILNGSNNQSSFQSAIQSVLTTSVFSQAAEKKKLSISPNPATDKITLHYSFSENSMVNISVVDALGRQMKKSNIVQTAGEHDIEIDFNEPLSNGIYFLQLKIGETTQSVKFTIAK